MCEFDALLDKLTAAIVDTGDEGALADTWLPPEAEGETHLQQARVQVGTLQARLTQSARAAMKHHAADAPKPPVIFVVSVARSCSTALLRVFGAAGMPAICQPLKNALRHHLLDLPYAWYLPDALEADRVVIKTTLGPFTRAESLFNPVAALLEAGYPADAVHLLVLTRDPGACLASWHRTWGAQRASNILEENFVLASLNLQRIQRGAVALGIPCEHYEPYAAGDQAGSLARLFERLGIVERYSPGVLGPWHPWGSPASRILTQPEPQPYRSPRAHKRLDHLRRQPEAPKPLSGDVQVRLEAHGAFRRRDTEPAGTSGRW